MNTQNKQTKININTSSDNGNYCNEANTALEVINNFSEIESENTHLKSSNNTVPLNQESELENVQIECTERIVKNSNSTETEILSESEESELHTINAVTPTEVEEMQSDCTETNIKNSNSIETESTTMSETSETEKFELDTINNVTPIQETELQNFQSDCTETTAKSNNSTENIMQSTTNSEISESEESELDTINNVTPIQETEFQNLHSDCTEKTTVTSSNSAEKIVPSTIPKRNHADNNSLSAESQRKKQKLEDSSIINAVSTVASQSKDSIRKSETNDETSNVRKDDQIALIVNGDPIIHLTKPQVNILERRLTEALNRSIKKQLTFQLAFHNKELLNGRYRITCANTDSMNWLIETVRSMGEIWFGSKLRVMVNQCCRVNVLLPNFDDTYYDFVDLIRAQNPGIETDLWKLFEKIPKATGNLFVLGINKESLDFIEANEGELFYGIGVVSFQRPQMQPRNKDPLRRKKRRKRGRRHNQIKMEEVSRKANKA